MRVRGGMRTRARPRTHALKACRYDAAADPHHLEGFISLAFAPDVTGPWTKVPHAVCAHTLALVLARTHFGMPHSCFPRAA